MTLELLIIIFLLPAKQLHFFSKTVFDYASAFVFLNYKNRKAVLGLSQTRETFVGKNHHFKDSDPAYIEALLSF